MCNAKLVGMKNGKDHIHVLGYMKAMDYLVMAIAVVSFAHVVKDVNDIV